MSLTCRLLIVALAAWLSCAARADVLYVDDDAPPGGDGLGWDTAYTWLRPALFHAAASGGQVTEIRVAQGTYTPDLGVPDPGPTCCEPHIDPGCDTPECESLVCAHVPGCCVSSWGELCVSFAEFLCGDLCDEGPIPQPSFLLVSGVALRGGYAGLGAPDPDARDIDAFPSVLSGDIDGDDDLSPARCCTPHATPGCDDPSPGEDCAATVCAELPYCCETEWDLLCAAVGRVYCDFEADCPELANNAYAVGATDAVTDAVLDGFTIVRARVGAYVLSPDTTVERCSFIDSRVGLFAPYDGVTVTDCTFSGIAGLGLAAHEGSTVTNCVFTGNAGTETGGMRLEGGVVTGCIFTGNRSMTKGGGMTASETAVIGCTFRDNESMFRGGGLRGGQAIGCTFENNTAVYGGGASGESFINCLFVGNSAAYGGAVAAYGLWPEEAELINCTLTNNTATSGGALWANDQVSVHNCVLWGNGPDEIAGGGEPLPVTVRFSDVQGGFPGAGNIDADPLFVDPAGGDYRLGPGSPCIDAGESQMRIVHRPLFNRPCDALDLDHDGDTLELLPVDIDGRCRFADDPGTPDTGCAAGAVVDMGAWEFGAPYDGPRVLYADLTGDGAVTVRDLLVALAQWGPCNDPCCLADLGHMYGACGVIKEPDGVVDVRDLYTILLFWNR
jgi:hypothetical protein